MYRGGLKAFPYQHTYKVPKEWLLEFLTSEDYNSITRKSKEHYAMIAAVVPKPRKPKLPKTEHTEVSEVSANESH